MIKAAIRKKYKQKRRELEPSECLHLSKAIVSVLIHSYSFEGKKVSVFLPIERFNEVDTWRLIKAVKADFFLPVMLNGNELKHIKYENEEQLVRGKFDVLEPSYGAEIDPFLLDIVIVPLLAFDKKGYRVGYGKGFYDRFLAKCNKSCQFIGVSFFEKFVQIDDVHQDDIPLHSCATPSGLIQFK